MGVAVPLSMEDIEREMHAEQVPTAETSTQREGISTWILLSGATPTKEPKIANRTAPLPQEVKVEQATKIDDKLERAESRRVVVKSKVKPTTPKPTNQPKKVEKVVTEKPRPKVPARTKSTSVEPRPTQANKKATTTTTTTEVVPVTEEPVITSTPSSTTVETTTFLILEPKDADFDLPQDRSPGITTKKPKRNNSTKNTKTKKNGTKTKTGVAEKKPAKTPPSKEKPLSTKIYNYLAREVMPTVGVGLVGLAVTAGLATYFLGPFAALRRSYDVADRKDDVYYYNNEEYAGPDGQSEEEMFGKVIAGMPANSPYRNSIKYTIYRPNQAQSPRPVRYDPKYAPPPPQYRYRNAGPMYQGPSPLPVYNKLKVPDTFPPQLYRQNNEVNIYRSKTQDLTTPKQTIEQEDDQQQFTSGDHSFGLSVVTPQSILGNQAITEPSPEENNILRRRSQFVVGSVQPDADDDHPNNLPVVDAVPEHGPRRKRGINELDYLRNDITDEDNEIEGVAPIREPTTEPNSKDKEDSSNSESAEIETLHITTVKPTTEKQNLLDLLKSIFEIKVRMGLSFLQNTTRAFQRYLKAVEKRVDESKLFARKE